MGGGTGAFRGDFPSTPGVLQPSFGGSFADGFVVRVSPVDPALPYVSGVSPLSGSVSGGATVRISGRGFGPVTAVSFGSTPAVSFTVDSSGQITAVSPAHAVGAAAVTVTTSAGTSPANPVTLFSYGQGRFRGTADPSTLGIKPVVLKDGRVLLFSPPTYGGTPASAQLYDPKTEAWTDTAPPTRLAAYQPDIRSLPYTATLLSNGKVLVTDGSSSPLADTAELYDPAGGGSWTDTAGPPSVKRAQASATRLDGPACRGSSPPSYCGKVLLAGGLDPNNSRARPSCMTRRRTASAARGRWPTPTASTAPCCSTAPRATKPRRRPTAARCWWRAGSTCRPIRSPRPSCMTRRPTRGAARRR